MSSLELHKIGFGETKRKVDADLSGAVVYYQLWRKEFLSAGANNAIRKVKNCQHQDLMKKAITGDTTS